MRLRIPDQTHLHVDKRYTDEYFLLSQDLLKDTDLNPYVLMQFFQKKESWLYGMDEVKQILKNHIVALGPNITIRILEDGSPINPFESVMTIEGPYTAFGYLETPILGVLARSTLIGTNVRRAVLAANGKPVWYFAARHDHWVTQQVDGPIALQAGASGVSTAAQLPAGSIAREKGTIPHALIAAYKGDTVAAALAFGRKYATEKDIIILVDWDNDCAKTATDVARAFHLQGIPLWGVRLDTSETLVDEGLKQSWYTNTQGVSSNLVCHVRNELNDAGFPNVKIIVSGGFTHEKIHQFEAAGVPADVYGVGSSLLRGSNDFTADIVMVDDKPCAKVGRQLIENPKLKEFK